MIPRALRLFGALLLTSALMYLGAGAVTVGFFSVDTGWLNGREEGLDFSAAMPWWLAAGLLFWAGVWVFRRGFWAKVRERQESDAPE